MTTAGDHSYAPLPAADNETVEAYLEYCTDGGKRAYRCLWYQCQREPFKGKHSARVHVQRHMGYDKLFYCLTCGRQFTTEDIAKRHQEGATVGKVYPCNKCFKTFSRKDYCTFHQDKCTGTPEGPSWI